MPGILNPRLLMHILPIYLPNSKQNIMTVRPGKILLEFNLQRRY